MFDFECCRNVVINGLHDTVNRRIRTSMLNVTRESFLYGTEFRQVNDPSMAVSTIGDDACKHGKSRVVVSFMHCDFSSSEVANVISRDVNANYANCYLVRSVQTSNSISGCCLMNATCVAFAPGLSELEMSRAYETFELKGAFKSLENFKRAYEKFATANNCLMALREDGGFKRVFRLTF